MRRKIRILQEKIDRLGSVDGELVPWIRLRLLDDVVAIAEGVADWSSTWSSGSSQLGPGSFCA